MAGTGKADDAFGPIIEWDNAVRSVLVVAVPTERYRPDHLANCFAEAARLIRHEALLVRGVQLSDVPEGLILFCDREDGDDGDD